MSVLEKIPEIVRAVTAPGILAGVAWAFTAGSIAIRIFDPSFGDETETVKGTFLVGAVSFWAFWASKRFSEWSGAKGAREIKEKRENEERSERVTAVTDVLEGLSQYEVALALKILARYRVNGSGYIAVAYLMKPGCLPSERNRMLAGLEGFNKRGLIYDWIRSSAYMQVDISILKAFGEAYEMGKFGIVEED